MIVGHIGGGSSGGYEIPKSLRLRASASAHLSRTPSVVGNRKTWTWGGWVKRGTLETIQTLFSTSYVTGGSAYGADVRFDPTGKLTFGMTNISGGLGICVLTTAQVFRDPTAHYHIHIVYDTTQITSSERMKLFVNGTRVLAFDTATYPPLDNATGTINNTQLHAIGRITIDGASSRHLDGYLSEINFIDGQALTPSSFGEFNSDGVWVPKKYTGLYGTNGFYLPFSDGSSLANLTADKSGNGNNWTANNISLTAGATYDWMDDTPSNNFAVLNPLDKSTAYAVTLTGANLSANVGGTSGVVKATFGVSSGQWYWEFLPLSSANVVGVVGVTRSDTLTDWRTSTGFGYEFTGNKATGNTKTAYGASYTSGDIIGAALDMGAGTLTFYKNGVSQGTAFTGISGGYSPSIQNNGVAGIGAWDCHINFGQRPFAYTPPTGFKALCTKNRGIGSITVSGSFTGNASIDGPSVWLNGNPETMTINGNIVTWRTHADKTAGGFKVRTNSTSYNATGTNNYVVTLTGKLFGDMIHAPNTAKVNP